MLWDIYPSELDHATLQNAYLSLDGDTASKIPFLVWLFENPESLMSLPGNIDLYRHDCLHLLLKKGFTASGEAYVLGFTMGNDPKTRWLHTLLYKLIARFLYPHPYRFRSSNIKQFEQGLAHGKTAKMQGLNQTSFQNWQTLSLAQLRKNLGL